jgi:catechol-2,3-dioxygenase
MSYHDNPPSFLSDRETKSRSRIATNEKFKFDHVAVCVSDIQKSTEWYIKNLSGSVLYSDSTWAMLLIGGKKIALTLSNAHPPHIAFSIEDEINFPQGLEVREHRDGSRYTYVSDPDGNTVEVISFSLSSAG